MNDLLLRALRGEPTERRPLWIMRQAGRYLPEYREMRERVSFEELCARPDLAAEVTLQPLERFRLDAAIVFADIMTPLDALGIDVRFDPGPVVDAPLTSAAAVAALPEIDPGAVAPSVVETMRLLKVELRDRLPVLGFAGGPWTLAAYLVQGQGVRDFPALRAMAAEDPGLLGRLLEKLTDLTVAHLRGQVQAGADAVQIFETWSGLLSLDDWSRLVKPHLKDLLDRLAEVGVPRILFMQDAAHLIDGMVDLPADGYSVDWRIDMAALRQKAGPRKAIQGNLDPAVLLAGPEVTRQAVEALLRRVPRTGHVFNLGHGITPQARIDSVEALIEAVHRDTADAAAQDEPGSGASGSAG